LVPITVTPDINELTPFQTEVAALNFIQGNKRLLDDLAVHGSCDLSHALGNKARFRVNIFTQQGHLSIVMRKMEGSIPTIQSLNLPEAFNKMTGEINVLSLSPAQPAPVNRPLFQPCATRSTRKEWSTWLAWKIPLNLCIRTGNALLTSGSWARL